MSILKNLKKYNQYVNEEVDWKKYNPFNRNKSSFNIVTKNKIEYENDPYGEEIWNEEILFRLQIYNITHQVRFLKFIRIDIQKRINNQYICQFVFEGNGNIFKLTLVSKNDKWAVKIIYGRNFIPCGFQQYSPECQRFIDYINKNYEEELKKIQKIGKLTIDSFF